MLLDYHQINKQHNNPEAYQGINKIAKAHLDSKKYELITKDNVLMVYQPHGTYTQMEQTTRMLQGAAITRQSLDSKSPWL